MVRADSNGLFEECFPLGCKVKMTAKYTFIDLFAGCGGLSLGMEQAGFSPVFANEIWNCPAPETRNCAFLRKAGQNEEFAPHAQALQGFPKRYDSVIPIDMEPLP